MSNIVISVENLSKRYLIGHQSAERERYTALRDVVGREVRNFARKAADLVSGRQIVQGDEVEELWALKDVNFEVKQGEPGDENAPVLARGIRYNGIAKKLSARKEIPAVGVALG